MHVESARSLRYVAAACLVDVLDVLPAYAICRHGMLRRLGLATLRREQRGDDVVRIRRFGEIVDGAELHCTDGGSDIAVARQNDRARIGPLLLERRNDVQAAPIIESHVHYGK